MSDPEYNEDIPKTPEDDKNKIPEIAPKIDWKKYAQEIGANIEE